MQFENIWNQVKDKNEAAIIKEYNYIARRDTIILTTFAVISGSICTIGQYLSNLIVLPKNISRLPNLNKIEYFIDQEKYFYLILLHFYALLCIGGVVPLALGTMNFTCSRYICGMFRIASYRIEHAININIRQNITLKNEILMREDIICAVDIHRQAMKLSKLLVFEVMVFCLIIFGMTCLILNLFQVSFLFHIVIYENVCKYCSKIMYINKIIQ
ncbi:PREDICTED: uncharacterized protein LOC108752712 [Trachymyrmex septentrionalis]|uniref:uncharacterized protein LOC108752712 n=1 Tax=Trachymyrmex septentrionalis TaxID=34720 RepID=UPI00084F0126|nr:PREDICTED: uncharacterized protein LOC108752712 [Trachymyrmex septentrionalis]